MFKQAVRRYDFPGVPTRRQLGALKIMDTIRLMHSTGSFGYAQVRKITDKWISAILLDDIGGLKRGAEIAVPRDRIFGIN